MKGDGRAQFVFGYGSLAALPERTLTREPDEHGFIAELRGFQRCWGVAMDNRRDLPGYKYYTRPDGYRPAVYVAFLDLIGAPSRGASVNGVCLTVDEAGLAALDERERNYRRLDVSDAISGARDRIWTYVGTTDGRTRLQRGRELGTAVVAAGYLGQVSAAFARLGEAERKLASRSLQARDLPVVELVRHALA